MGGLVAYEMAQRLLAEGREVRLLILLDTPAPGTADTAPLSDVDLWVAFAADLGIGRETLAPFIDQIRQTSRAGDGVPEILDAARCAGVVPPDLELSDLNRLFQVFRVNVLAMSEYRALPYPGHLALIAAAEGRQLDDDPTLGWESLVKGDLEAWKTPGDHYHLLHEPQVVSFAKRLAETVQRACSPSGCVNENSSRRRNS